MPDVFAFFVLRRLLKTTMDDQLQNHAENFEFMHAFLNDKIAPQW